MAGGLKAKQISRHFEYFSAWCGWMLFLQMHQTVPATGTTGVNDMMPWGQGLGPALGFSSLG